MRAKTELQSSIFELFSEHNNGQELFAISKIIDENPRLVDFQRESFLSPPSEFSEPDLLEAFSYDNLLRLSTAQYANADGYLAEEFYYDKQGNMITRGGNTPNPGDLVYQDSPDINLDGEVDDNDLYSMDLFGNQQSDLNGDGQTTLVDAVHSVENQRVLAKTDESSSDNRLEGWVYHDLGMTTQTPDGMTYQYNLRNKLVQYGSDQFIAYDTEDKRMATWSNASPNKNYTVFGANGKPLAEYTWDGVSLTLDKEHYYMGETEIASDIWNNGSCPERIYLHSDHLGSPRNFSDSSGNFIGFKDYLAFGNSWNQDTTCLPIATDYTGHQTMTNSGNPNQNLVWMQARTYHPTYGRFIEPDPIKLTPKRFFKPQEMALYSYVANNPGIFVDPTGEALKLRMEGEVKQRTVRDLQKLTDDTLGVLNDGTVVITARGEGNKPLGTSLLRDLIENDNGTNILIGGYRENGFLPQKAEDALAKGIIGEFVMKEGLNVVKDAMVRPLLTRITGTGKGTSGSLLYNPFEAMLNVDGTISDPYMNLAHELIHAYHAKHGTAAGGKLEDLEQEQQAIGLGKYSSETYTENALRKEQNIKGMRTTPFGRE